jgi:uncharacterized membrane protein
MAPLAVLVIVSVLVTALLVLRGGRPAAAWPDGVRLGLAAMLLVTATTHFVWMREDLVAMVPPALPAPGLLVTLSGIAELAVAAGLLVRRSAASAGLALAGLLVVLFPANVYAAVADVELQGQAATPLPLRTAIQVVFVAAALAVHRAYRRNGDARRTVAGVEGASVSG